MTNRVNVEDLQTSKLVASWLLSDIKSIENMINGLNGSHEGRFGLNHDARIS